MNPFAESAAKRRFLFYGGLVLLLSAVAVALIPVDAAWSHWSRTWIGPARSLVDDLISIVRLFGQGEIAVLVALLAGALGYRRQAARILVALAVVAVVVTAIKFGIGRARPSGSSGYSFPSGDEATAIALLLPLAMEKLRRLPWAALLALGVAYGRVHQGYHYPTDVAAGAAVGVIAVAVSELVLAGRSRFPGASAHLLVGILFSALVLTLRSLEHGTARGDLATFILVFAPVFLAALGLRYHRAMRYWVRRYRLSMTPLGWGTLLVLTALFLIWFSSRSTLWDRDEPRFATASVEMLHSGHLLVPTFNGEPRLHKPAGIYWLMAPALALGGVHEWAARLPAVLATLMTVLLTWFIGLRLRDSTTGLYAAGIMLVTPLVLVSGTGATTDAVLLALSTAAMAIIINALVRRDRASEARLSWWSTIALGACLGAGMLVKGPMALLPILTTLLVCIAIRHTIILARSFWWRFATACLLCLALFAAWGIPANLATKGAFLSEGVGKHLIQRGTDPMEGHHGGPGYYLMVIVAAFFPWSALLPLASVRLGRWTTLGRAVAWCWLLPALVILTIYATKLPHYILPTFPALALMVAVCVTDFQDQLLPARDRRLLLAGRVLLVGIALALAAGLTLAPWAKLIPLDHLGASAQRSLEFLQHVDGLIGPTIGLALIFVLLARLGGRALRDGRLRQATAVMFACMAACALSLGLIGLPSFDRYKPSAPLALAIRKVTSAQVPVWVADYDEPSLHFYLQRGPILPIPDNDVAAWAAQPGIAVLVISREMLGRCDPGGALPLREITSDVEGLNLANGHWVDLVAVARGL